MEAAKETDEGSVTSAKFSFGHAMRLASSPHIRRFYFCFFSPAAPVNIQRRNNNKLLLHSGAVNSTRNWYFTHTIIIIIEAAHSPTRTEQNKK